MGLRVHAQDIVDFCRCEQKAKYSLWKGYRPKQQAAPMSVGALIHHGLMAGYRELRANGPYKGAFVLAAKDALGYASDDITTEDYVLAAKVIEYYWENIGQNEQMDEILLVEEPISVPFLQHEVTMTFDLVYRRGLNIYIRDHKTTGGSVKEALATIDRDVQFGTYIVGAAKYFRTDPILMVNLIRRAVPRIVTKSGRPSTSSKNPADYLRQQRIWKTPEERHVMEHEILAVLRRMEQADQERWWKRTPIKTGGEACAHCPYYDICGVEYQRGEDLSEAEASLLYQIERREGSVAPSH